MQIFRKQFIAIISAGLVLFASLMPVSSFAADIEETPSAGAMAGDLLIARPLLLVTTVLGTALYVVSLPFTLLGGNSGEAAEVLVLDPAAATFLRCLGCENTDRADDADEDVYQASAQYSPAQPKYIPSNYNEPIQPSYELSDAVVSNEDVYPSYTQKPKKTLGLKANIGVSSNRSFGVDNSTGYQLGLGYRLLDSSWGFVEADVAYFSTGTVEEPDADDNVEATFSAGAEYETTGFIYGGNFGLKLGDSFSTYAKYGRSSWGIELTRDGDKIDSADGSGSYYGVGFGYEISKTIGASLEYTDFEYKKNLYRYDNDITSYIANLSVKF